MLTDAEYKEIMENKRELELQIVQAEADQQYHDELKDAADARKDHLDLRMSLYNNFLAAAIAEYEAAHPPENP